VISQEGRTILLQTAADSIRYGLHHGQALAVQATDYPAELQAVRATFVTLTHLHHLRGCIGMLEARRPLVEDVAENAFAAAFRDPRFPPLEESELWGLDVHISILTPAEAMSFTSEEDLVAQLRPGVDGLILHEHGRRGTYLPSVWESLPKPRDFLDHLKQKAGLPTDYWSDTLSVERYTTESFGGHLPHETAPH